MVESKTLSVSSCRIRSPRLAPIGGADSDLPLASGGSGKQKIGDVGASDQKNKADGSHQDQESLTNISHQRVAQGHHRDSFVFIHPLGIGGAELLTADGHIRLRGIQSRAGLEAAGSEEVVGLIGAIRVGLHGQKDVGWRIGLKVRGEDSDHGVRIAAEQDRPADERRVASETVSPDIVAQDDGFRAVRLILLGKKGSSNRRRHAENVEIFGGDVNALDLLGAVA